MTLVDVSDSLMRYFAIEAADVSVDGAVRGTVDGPEQWPSSGVCGFWTWSMLAIGNSEDRGCLAVWTDSKPLVRMAAVDPLLGCLFR